MGTGGVELPCERKRHGMKALRDLDWNSDIDHISRFFDARPHGHGLVRVMRSAGLALASDIRTQDEVRPEHVLVEVLVRLAHHPAASLQPSVWLEGNVDAAARLVELASARFFSWDGGAVRDLLVRHLVERHGGLEVDETRPPWLRDWGAAGPTASTLILVVGFEAAGGHPAYLSGEERVETALAVMSAYARTPHVLDAGARRRGFIRAFVDDRSEAELASLAARLASSFMLGAGASGEDSRRTIDRALDLIFGPADASGR
jgi:hypothetical protein